MKYLPGMKIPVTKLIEYRKLKKVRDATKAASKKNKKTVDKAD